MDDITSEWLEQEIEKLDSLGEAASRRVEEARMAFLDAKAVLKAAKAVLKAAEEELASLKGVKAELEWELDWARRKSLATGNAEPGAAQRE